MCILKIESQNFETRLCGNKCTILRSCSQAEQSACMYLHFIELLEWVKMGYPRCNLSIQTLNVRSGDLTKNFQVGCILRLIWFWHDCKIEFSTTTNDCKTSLSEQKGWDKGRWVHEFTQRVKKHSCVWVWLWKALSQSRVGYFSCFTHAQ